MAVFRRIWDCPVGVDGFCYKTAVYSDEVYIGGLNGVEVTDKKGVYQRSWLTPGSPGPGRIVQDVAAYNGEIYTSTRSAIYVYDTHGNAQRNWTNAPTGFGQTIGIVIYNEEAYVLESDNRTEIDAIWVFDLQGVLQRAWGSRGTGDGEFLHAHDLAIYNDEVYVADDGNSRVQVFDTNGNFKRKWGSYGSGDSEFALPSLIDICPQTEEVYVGERKYGGVNGSRFKVFDLDGTYKGKSTILDPVTDNKISMTGLTISGGEIYITDVDALKEHVYLTYPILLVHPTVPIPDYPLKESKYYDTIVTDMQGKKNSRSRYTTPIRTWSLNFSSINDGDCNYLWTFFKNRKGDYERFYFFHPETNEAYMVRFTDSSLKRDEIGNKLYNVTINLTEVLNNV